MRNIRELEDFFKCTWPTGLNETARELVKRFLKIAFNPRDFSYYVAFHEYMDFVYTNETTVEMIRHGRDVYYELRQLIIGARDRAINQCDRNNPKLINKVSRTFSVQMSRLEATNLYCLYLGPKQIHYAVEEMNGAELFKSDLEMSAREDQTNDLEEIRMGAISRKNGLIECADDIYKELVALHYGLLDRLATVSEKEMETVQPKSEGSAETPPPLFFDRENSIFHLLGEKIPIAIQDKLTIAHKILTYMLAEGRDPSQEFFYSEIAADLFGDEKYHGQKNAWRRYYNACKEINEKVRKNTLGKIEDFLNFNSGIRGRVLVTQKYLGNRAQKDPEKS